ncbi:MAG TPA: polysaccharide biosynthesis C-terminal domain-containing protein [Pyrinomonadaceae bacterium]|nr:polysaccharide biosynthesis C-terminal domain-containing protein [Pyrinomonadaceae bacterium]
MLRSLIFRTLLTNGGITVLSLANSVLLSRWLGPTGRGEVAAAMLWPILLVYLSSMGLIISSVYFTSLSDSKPQIVFNTAIVFGLILSAVALPIGYLALPALLKSQSSQVISLSRLFLLVIPISLIAQLGTGVLQGRLQIVELNWLRTLIPLGYLMGTLVLIILGRLLLINILILHLLLNTIVLFGTLKVLAKSSIYLGLHTNADLATRMLKYGVTVHVGNISGLANVNLAQVFMAAWLSPAYLGLYVVAVSAAGLSQAFSQAVQTVAIPSITQKESKAERVAILQRIFRQYWMISLVIALAVGILLPVGIPLVFGIGFKSSIWPAEVLLLGSVIVGAKLVLAGGAQALGDPWLSSKAQLYAFLATIIALYFLLPAAGIMGAAVATTIAYSTELAVVIHGLRRVHSISPLELFRFNPTDLRSTLSSIGVLKAYGKRFAANGLN